MLGGYLTPFLLSTGEDHPWFLLSYIFLLDGAAMLLLKRKSWRVLEWLALLSTTLIYFFWFYSHAQLHRGSAAGTVAALAYYALFG